MSAPLPSPRLLSGEATGAPRLSLVVPCHKVQGYLRECLESVLSQSFGDFEVIAVDDCSPDATGRILDEFAARDPRVRAVHLEQNGGVGHARNTGVRLARGEYLVFLDGDDTLLPGTFQALVERISATGGPDIVVYDYARTYWWGKVARNRDAEVLSRPGPEVFTVDEHPELLDMFTVVWNKAYRRDFFLEHGFTFPPGYYEDMVVAYESMFTARRIALLDRVCVHYRQRRTGNALRSPDRRHFAVFEQYERLFRFLADHPGLARWQGFLYRHMADHYLFILGRRDRVPPRARREFFRRAARDLRRFRPVGHRPQGLRHRLMRHRLFLAYTVLEAATARLAGARKRLRRRRNALARSLFRLWYRLQLCLPLKDDLAVYAAYWNRGAQCNPLAVYEAAKALAPRVRGVWAVSAAAAAELPPGIDHVVVSTRRYWQVMARAGYLVNNVNFPDGVVKRPGQVHVQTHHGTPLKKMGIDQRAYPAAARGMSFAKLLRRCDRWDYSISSNGHSTEVWERVYPVGFTTLESGYPRNDVFYRAGAEEVLGCRSRLGLPAGKTAVLYAPTVRDYRRGFTPLLDPERLVRALGPDFVLLVRAHYLYQEAPGLRDLERHGLLIDVSRHPSVEELCLAADVLVTDYSSIMFDYANLDRPIVTYAPDWEVYRQSRGVYFDLLSGRPGDTPGAVARTEEELAAVFRDGTWDSAEASALRAAFRERFCAFDDGRAAERVVRRVFLGEADAALPPVVPPGERRPAPAPRSAAATPRSAAAR
ncbi:bifunctional glycosyltransferase/CDP-glycerol:glycerophosphate glycerophosphotransferase [Streptomyces sp. GC420]|uniref:bifunctional glycosyltransferase/CDP-glycerol:glycerophosphate glycerophosphotransferase n=1 Tax=Streptomyces sp. GC420 TaxID=2697568 RepID=UPI001414D90E|nr:bifunctional glycosyltransferase/CDP-glycerol:glycerophosphate glycerophosphotransferase [Streptomyces sp. GC420]NBM20945.1 glycosyltransferase [Streptomyces sp. GC420]